NLIRAAMSETPSRPNGLFDPAILTSECGRQAVALLGRGLIDALEADLLTLSRARELLFNETTADLLAQRFPASRVGGFLRRPARLTERPSTDIGAELQALRQEGLGLLQELQAEQSKTTPPPPDAEVATLTPAPARPAEVETLAASPSAPEPPAGLPSVP